MFESIGFKFLLIAVGYLAERLLDYRKKYIRNKRLGDLTQHMYFKTEREYSLFLSRYIAPDNNRFYTIIIKLYHGAILEKFSSFAQAITHPDVVKSPRKVQLEKIKKLYFFYAREIIAETDAIGIPEPLFSAIRKESLGIVDITQFGIFKVLEAPKFENMTNKEISSSILYELDKFLQFSETNLIPSQGRLNGKYKGLVFNYKGEDIINE